MVSKLKTEKSESFSFSYAMAKMKVAERSLKLLRMVHVKDSIVGHEVGLWLRQALRQALNLKLHFKALIVTPLASGPRDEKTTIGVFFFFYFTYQLIIDYIIYIYCIIVHEKNGLLKLKFTKNLCTLNWFWIFLNGLPIAYKYRNTFGLCKNPRIRVV